MTQELFWLFHIVDNLRIFYRFDIDLINELPFTFSTEKSMLVESFKQKYHLLLVSCQHYF